MHDEASLRRLEEMGIDVYLPRHAGVSEAALSSMTADASAAGTPIANKIATTNAATAAVASAKESAGTSAGDADVLLLADTAAHAEPLLAAVARTLAFARVTSAKAGADDAGALGRARALVVFGETQARAAGAALSAQRQAQIGWVVAADVARFRGDALAKRALWGELKRVVRLLRES